MPKLTRRAKYQLQPTGLDLTRASIIKIQDDVYTHQSAFLEDFILLSDPGIGSLLTNARTLTAGDGISITDTGALGTATLDNTLVVISAFEPTTTFAGMLWLQPKGPAASETMTLSDSPTVSIV